MTTQVLHVILPAKSDNNQGSSTPSLFPFKEREFRPGISLIPTEELIKLNPQYGDLRAVDPLADYPWTEGLDPIAPEKEAIPVPCGFTEVLAIMVMSESEQMDSFLNLMETHIDPEFAKATDILKFMREEGIIVFTNLKQNWNGIQGVDPVHVEFTEDLPARLKPATRKIPTAILEVAKKEFDRLRTYFLIPSTSPVASNITVASKASPPMFVYAEISEESTNSSLPTMVPFLMFDSTLIAYPTTISSPILTSRMDSIRFESLSKPPECFPS